MNRRAVTPAELVTLVGTELGTSEWTLIDQRRIDSFADITEDRQFIHVDPEAARRTPLGTTIAHGFLSLSLIAAFSEQVVPRVDGARMALNYGINRLRFLSPVRCGARVRGRFTLRGVEQQDRDRYLQTFDVTVEIEHGERPALALEWLILTLT